MRAPYNVLVLPYCQRNEGIRYCIFERNDMKIWQFIAGGGEDDESPELAAKREMSEETGIENVQFSKLTSMTYVPTFYFSEKSRNAWGQDVLVIPVYCFSVEMTMDTGIALSDEHTHYQWVDYETAVNLLNFDIDKTAIWELDSRLYGSLG